MRKILIVLAALVMAAPATADSFRVSAEGDYTEAQAEILHTVLNDLGKACAPLFTKYAQDVETATVRFVDIPFDPDLPDRYGTSYGWTKYLEVEIRIVRSPSIIPGSFRAGGHFLRYRIGGGIIPGVETEKMQAREVCGWPAGELGNNELFPMDAALIVDKFGSQKRTQHAARRAVLLDLIRQFAADIIPADAFVVADVLDPQAIAKAEATNWLHLVALSGPADNVNDVRMAVTMSASNRYALTMMFGVVTAAATDSDATGDWIRKSIDNALDSDVDGTSSTTINGRDVTLSVKSTGKIMLNIHHSS